MVALLRRQSPSAGNRPAATHATSAAGILVVVQCHHQDLASWEAKASGFTSSYDTIPLLPVGRAALHKGANVIAAHCHQTGGGQFLGIGLVNVTAPAH